MATDATLEYLIKVQDRDLKELQKSVKETNKALGDTGDVSSKSSSGIGKLGKVAKVAAIGVGLGAAGLAYGLKKCIDAAMESQKVTAQTAAVIKSTGGAAKISAKQVDTMATSLAMKSGIDDEVIASGENMLLTFTNIRNEVGKGNDVFNQSTSILADMSTALGTDMSKQAIQLGKALNDPIKGISALSRVGVTFTADQKAVIKSLMDTGDTAGAQKVILQELNKEFGGSAEAAGKTLPGQLAIAKVAFGNLEEEIGGKLLPVLTSVVTWVNAHWTEISAVIDAVATAIKVAFNSAIIPAVEAGITVVKAMVAWVKAHWSEISTDFMNVFNACKQIVNTFVSVVTAYWNTFGSTIIAEIRGALNQVKIVIDTELGIIKGLFHIFHGLLTGDWSEMWNGMKGLVSSVFNGIVATIKNLIGTVGSVALSFGSAILNGIVNGLKGLGSKLLDLIISPINAVIGKINSIKIPGFSFGGVKILGKTVPGTAFDFPSIDPIPGDIPQLASGGIVRRPTFAMIGERGPEAVIPLSGFGQRRQVIENHIYLDGTELAFTIRDQLVRIGRNNVSVGF